MTLQITDVKKLDIHPVIIMNICPHNYVSRCFSWEPTLGRSDLRGGPSRDLEMPRPVCGVWRDEERERG